MTWEISILLYRDRGNVLRARVSKNGEHYGVRLGAIGAATAVRAIVNMAFSKIPMGRWENGEQP